MPLEEMDLVLKKVIDKHDPLDADLRPSVVVHAREKSVHHLIQKEYDDATDCDIAIDFLLAKMRTDGIADDFAEQTHKLQKKFNYYEKLDKTLTQKKREYIDADRAELQRQLGRLQERHESEQRDFEMVWSDESAKRHFNRPSVQLLQLRQQQKAFALVHDFQSAKAFKQVVEVMERREITEGVRKYEEAVRIAWQQLKEKQEKERPCLIELRDYELVVATTEKDQKIASNGLLRESLKRRKDGPKHLKRPNIRVPGVKGSGIPGNEPSRPYAMITKRTRSQLLMYRIAADTRRLDLNPPAVRMIVKPGSRMSTKK
jgi:hypothetical protein